VTNCWVRENGKKEDKKMLPVSADTNGFINGMTQTPPAERSRLFNFEGAFET
jgi:hypothetical protein